MYVPPHFEEVDPQAIAALMETFPLACIVAQTQNGLITNHIPLVAAPEGDRLIGHVALANDMHRLIPAGQEVVAIFRGGDGYVSPNFYPGKAEHHRHVPTWNYEVVHVHGAIFFQQEVQAKRAAVALLTRRHEKRVNGANAWRMTDAPPDYIDDMLGQIVVLWIEVGRVVGKSKMSQNREQRDYLGAIDGLKVSGETDLAHRMTERAARLLDEE